MSPRFGDGVITSRSQDKESRNIEERIFEVHVTNSYKTSSMQLLYGEGGERYRKLEVTTGLYRESHNHGSRRGKPGGYL